MKRDVGFLPPDIALDEYIKECKRTYIMQVMMAADGNVALAARIAGRNRTEFYRLLDSLGIKILTLK